MYQHASAMHQQVHSINSSAVELSANLVRRAMLHRAEGESYAPAGAFNQKHSIDANRRREFLQQEKCQQAIGDNSRRDFHPQVKSQQAIDASRRRAIDQQVDSNHPQAGWYEAHSKISFRLIAIESFQLEDSS